MSWVKLGSERVNTDAIAHYYANDWPGGWLYWDDVTGTHHSWADPDGALLRALDAACGLLVTTQVGGPGGGPRTQSLA